MIKLINIITQIIIVLGCCAILIFTLSKVKIMKTRKHFIRKYELLARCIQTNLELFILQ